VSEFWLRELEVSTGGAMFHYPEFEIELEVEFDETPDPDRATVSLYNISPSHETQIKQGEPITIAAGYQGDVGTVLVGLITDVSSYWDGINRVCEIEAVDAAAEYLEQTISRTYMPGATTKAVLTDVLTASGLEVGVVDLPNNTVYLNGKVVEGRIKTVAEELAEDGGAKLYIMNGTINAAPPEYAEHLGVYLDSEHGLLRSPTRVDSDEAEWEIETLLHYRIRAGTLVDVSSDTANGVFRVVSGRHTSNSTSHKTTIQVVEAEE